MAFGLLSSWWMTDTYHSSKASRLALAAGHERAEAFRWVASEQKRSAAAMAVADTEALAEVRGVQEEAKRLLGCIDSGHGCGLRVKVVRSPAKCGELPETASAPGMGSGSGEWAELDRAAQQAYFSIRERIPVIEQALRLCVSQWQK